MGDNSRISWTDATWNPVSGCTKVSEGCANCYIDRTPPFRIARRRFLKSGVHDRDCQVVTASNWQRMQETIECTCRSSDQIGATTGVTLHPERLQQPLRWRRPRRIFVNSLSDVFHDEVPDSFIAQMFAVMAASPQHTYQVLTKRPARMRTLLTSRRVMEGPGGWMAFEAMVRNAYSALKNNQGRCIREDEPRGLQEVLGWANAEEFPWPLPNVWLGVSAENQKWADRRIPQLLETPAAVRFVSMEPLLGPVNLTRLHGHCPTHDFEGGFCSGPCPDLIIPDWVIVGGESGPNARPMHPDWARKLRDQCRQVGIPFWFKQWGEWVEVPIEEARHGDQWLLSRDGAVWGWPYPWREDNPPQAGADEGRWADERDVLLRRVGTKTAGHLIEGVEYHQWPAAVAVELAAGE